MFGVEKTTKTFSKKGKKNEVRSPQGCIRLRKSSQSMSGRSGKGKTGTTPGKSVGFTACAGIRTDSRGDLGQEGKGGREE